MLSQGSIHLENIPLINFLTLREVRCSRTTHMIEEPNPSVDIDSLYVGRPRATIQVYRDIDLSLVCLSRDRGLSCRHGSSWMVMVELVQILRKMQITKPWLDPRSSALGLELLTFREDKENTSHFDSIYQDVIQEISRYIYARILFDSSRTISFAPIVPVLPPTPKVKLIFPRSWVVFSRTVQLRLSFFFKCSST